MRCLRALAVALALTSAALPAAAQPREDPSVLFNLGTRAFARHAYRQALDAFQRAYALSGNPVLLFNVARTWQRMGEPGEAARALRRYLVAVPDDPERADHERQIAELEAEDRRIHGVPTATAQSRSGGLPAPDAGTRTQASPAPRGRSPVSAPRVEPSGRSAWPWVLGGAGIVLAGVGAGLLVGADATLGDLSQSANESAWQRSLNAGRTERAVAWSMMGAGAAVMVGALVWGLTQVTVAPHSPVRVGVAPLPGGARVGLTWRGSWL